MKTAILICCLALTSSYAQPLDQPQSVDGKKATEAHNRALKPYIAKAMATYPEAKGRFLAGLPTGDKFYVMTRLYGDAHAKATEDVYVLVREIVLGDIRGTIDSDILLVKNRYKKGQHIAFRENRLMDWMILHADGREEGRVVGKYIDSLRQ